MVWHVWARRNSLERIAGTSCQVRPQLLSLRNLLFSPTILKCLYSTLAQSKNKTSSACYGSSCLTAWHPQEHSRTKSTKHMCGLYEVVGMWLSCLGTVVPCFSQGLAKATHAKNNALSIHFPLNCCDVPRFNPKPPSAASPPGLFPAPCDSAAHQCFPKLDI